LPSNYKFISLVSASFSTKPYAAHFQLIAKLTILVIQLPFVL